MSSRSSSPQAILDGLKQGVVWGAAALAVLLPPVGGARTALTSPSVQAAAATAPRLPRYADFGAEVPSAAARHVADWVADSGEGRWTVAEAIDLDVPAPVITLALLQRLRSRDAESYGDRLLAALRNQFGGHAVKAVEDAKGGADPR